MKTKFFIVLIYLGFTSLSFAQISITNGACDLGIMIPDNNCIEALIPIFNAPGTALGQDVFLKEVRLIINHPWRNDLQVNLANPDRAISVKLIDERGGSSDHYGDPVMENCTSPIILTDSDCASDSIKYVTSSSNTVGRFVPEEALANFYLPIPFDPNDTWILEVCDDKFGDQGILEYAALIFEPIGCPKPTTLNVGQITGTSIELNSENAPNCEGQIVVEYGPQGFTPGNGAFAGSPNSRVVLLPCLENYTITALEQLTVYDIYVRQLCAAYDYAYNACKVTLSTDCILPPVSLFEDFNNQMDCDNGGACIDCPTVDGLWKNVPEDDIDWIINSGSTITSNTGPDDDVTGGEQYIYLESSATCRPAKEAILVSECIEIVADTGICHLSFYYHLFGINVNALHLEISKDDGQNWEHVWSQFGNQGNEWKLQYIDLSEYHQQLVKIRFRGISAAINFRGDIGLDNITFYGSTISDQKIFADTDGDGFGDKNNFMFACGAEGYVIDSTDCNDTDENIFPTTTDLSITICPGSTYEFNGETVSEAGIYFDTLVDVHGCDSFLVLDLVIDMGDSADAGEDQFLCSNRTILDAQLEQSAIGSWSVVSGDGLHIFEQPENPNTVFMGSSGENYTLEWLVFDKDCFLLNRDTVHIHFGNTTYMDADLDGVADCDDLCPNADDRINSDGQGMPDACDCDPNDPSDEYIKVDGDQSNNQIITSDTYQGSFSLSSHGTVKENSTVHFKAGYEIQLLPGFKAEYGSSFIAKIERCEFIPENILRTNFAEEKASIISTPKVQIPTLKIYPNPSREYTNINFFLVEKEIISLKIFDQTGNLIKTFYQQTTLNSGSHNLIFERNSLPSGVYLVQLKMSRSILTQKLILLY